MINWTCPFCHAAASLKPEYLNQEVTCSKCDQDSIVRREKPSQAAAKSPPQRIIHSTSEIPADPSQETLISVVIARVVIILGLIASIYLIATGDQPVKPIGWAGVLSVPLTWVITIAAEEAYRARRLLEQIARK